MSKNKLTKDELKVRVLKLKNKLNSENYTLDPRGLAHKYLDAVLNILDEYRY